MTVSLFGHRELDDFRIIEQILARKVNELLDENEYVIFLVGRNGEFDELAASVIKHAKRQRGDERCEMNLVLPYRVVDVEFYDNYYDSVFIPDELPPTIHPKRAIVAKNRIMIERSDEVVLYVNKDFGGAYEAYKYATKLGKRVVNLADLHSLPIQ